MRTTHATRYAAMAVTLLPGASLLALGLCASLLACGRVLPRGEDHPDPDAGGNCDGSVDDCGVCNGNNQGRDCAGVCFGSAQVDACGTCDADPTNNCWPGTSGTMTFPESSTFDLGSGTLLWSICCDQRGYFYAGSFTNPPTSIARATTASQCASNYSGYVGFNTVRDVGDAANLSFSDPNPTVMFGSRAHTCNMGVIVFKQGNRYGVIDFLSIDATQKLTLKYWLAAPGVSDFSTAPL